MKIAIVTNIPTPYRIPVYNTLCSMGQVDLQVIYCDSIEDNRSWSINNINHPHVFLKRRVRAHKDGFNYIHNNYDVIRELRKYSPDVIITTGFNPTHLYAYGFSRFSGASHISMTDGTIYSESMLGWKHRLVRRIVFKYSKAFIGAGQQSAKLFISYGVGKAEIFKSPLCANNEMYLPHAANSDRPYGIIFSGQFHERKLPFFFSSVVKEIVRRRKTLKVLLMGDGPLRDDFLSSLREAGADVDYPGFLQQADLPAYYSKGKVLLFPTRLDAWGVVSNEAMATGTPVVTTPYTGAAGDLIIDGKTGFVRNLDVSAWVDVTLQLLENEKLWSNLSQQSINHVEGYSYDVAALGILSACKHAMGHK